MFQESGILKRDASTLRLNELVSKLGSSENGLTNHEATERLARYGKNILEKKGVSALTVLLRQFKSSLIYLLIAASAIAYSVKDHLDGTVILVILLLNTSLGFFEEYRSEKFVEKLSKFITRQVRVKRDGQTVLIDESGLVVGDVIIVREGDIAPADIRLISSENLEVNESQLTGESVPVVKKPESDGVDPTSLVFAGSVIEKGEGIGVVYAIGNNTELGKVAALSSGTRKETQYEKALGSFSSLFIKIVLIGLTVVLALKIFLSPGFSNITSLLLFVIALAVATVPEVLPVIATLTLSRGALKLAKNHVVVRRLSSLEDLGNVNLLCTDKTGTITENRMSIKKITSPDAVLFQTLAYAAITPVKGRKRRPQNSYDDAFTRYVPENIKKDAENIKIVKELPFDPKDRRSRVLLADEKNKRGYMLSIGAPEPLIEISRDSNKGKYLTDISAEGGEGLHHLAIAYKEVETSPDFDLLKNEHGMKFLGYVSLEDPLRPTAKSTVRLAEELGIRIKLITGDAREVAGYVGRQISLIGENDRVYVGDELEKMNEGEFKKTVERYNVFARVSPEQKYNIIKALKENNVVGYQGDGINDAPAMKLADVGIAVNSATDIAKENADIVLLNKSLEVVINGIEYGRSIFVNINKYVRYTMINNFGMLVSLAVLYLFSANLPILPVQALLNNLLGDAPLTTVSTDTVDKKSVIQPEKQNIKELMYISLFLGLPTALFEIFYFLLVKSQPERMARTSLFVFFTLQALVIFYAVRNKGHFWKTKAPSAILNIFFAADFVFSISIIYIHQFQEWFSFTPLPLKSILLIFLLVVPYFVAVDFAKVWYYKLLGSGKPNVVPES